MEEDFEAFRKAIKKVSGKRHHKIKNSYGIYDAYKDIRKNQWFDIGKPLSESEFYSIIRTYNKHIVNNILQGKEVQLPQGMGNFEIRKRRPNIRIENGKLKITHPIDWDATLRLWYEDKDSRNNKILVRDEKPETFYFYYNKISAKYNNKSFYEFRPMRQVKNEMLELIKQGNLEGYNFKTTK